MLCNINLPKRWKKTKPRDVADNFTFRWSKKRPELQAQFEQLENTHGMNRAKMAQALIAALVAYEQEHKSLPPLPWGVSTAPRTKKKKP